MRQTLVNTSVLVPLLLVAVVAGGCSATDPQGDDPPRPSTSRAAETEVVVTVEAEERPYYYEGFVPYVDLRSASGEPVSPSSSGEAETTWQVPPGDYGLRAGLRVCNGNCGSLGPPTDQCERVLRVSGPTEVSVLLRPGRSCEAVVAATTTGGGSQPGSGCRSGYDVLATATTWARLRRELLHLDVHGVEVEGVRTQVRGADVGVGSQRSSRVIDLLDERGARLVQGEVWRTPDGRQRAGVRQQCID